MDNAIKIIARGVGVTNPQTGSVVTVQAAPSVQVTYRFFAADETAKLKGTSPEGYSRNLQSFPYVVGLVLGGRLQPFDKTIKRLPPATEHVVRMHNGVLQPLSSQELSRYQTLSAKAGEKSARDQLAADFAGTHKVKAHVVIVPQRIESGQTVGVCFGVDVKAKFRTYPLWQVTAGDHDIVVDVFETYGRHALNDRATRVGTVELGKRDALTPTDVYSAELSGNVWLRSTHPFTDADVDALPSATASDALKLALKRIYAADFGVERNGDFGIEVASHPEGDPGRKLVKLQWLAAENGNCLRNIVELDVKQEVPRRIHPAAYAAVARAAHQAGVAQVKFSSSWRPMLGSRAHRLGLGLDLTWIVEGGRALRLNHVGLRGKSLTDSDSNGVVDGTFITVAEQRAFNDWKAAELAMDEAESASSKANADLKAAQKALAEAEKSGDAEQVERAQRTATDANKASVDASTASKTATKLRDAKREDWTRRLEEHQPAAVGRFRRAVMQEACITQVIDPWYVDLNTRDEVAPVPNDQADGAPKEHANHMHLTIDDPELRE